MSLINNRGALVYSIMIVEDEYLVRQGISSLVDFETFDMEVMGEAENGLDAWEKIQLAQPDIVLTDINMPHINGIKLAQLVKEQYPSVHIIFLTGYDDFDYALSAVKLGADDYLPKPFNDRELVARIKAILRRSTSSLTPQPITQPIKTSNSPEEHKGKPLSFNGIELHSGRQQAIYNGQDLELTGTEFSLLQILIQNPGVILSRELLNLEILGKTLTPYDRAIDMHISNLRKKLPEREDNLPWFKTLRGRGYLLVTGK